MNKPNDEVLLFLWDKWRHHDQLLYQYSANFWAIQAIAIAGFSILADKLVLALPIGLILLGLLGVFFFRPILIVARFCRNTFNDKIVALLHKKGIVSRSDELFDLENWDPSLDQHRTNLWHTPIRRGNTHKVRGSAIMQRLIVWVSWAEFLTGMA